VNDVPEPRPWHAEPADDVLAALDASPEGLTAAEARARLARFGPNRLEDRARRSALARFAAQFHDVLIYVLLVAGVVTALLGHGVDSGVIFAVVLVNALIGFVQEGRAERALDAIRAMLSLRAVVVRAGETLEVPAETLVPGDVVLLRSGDKVPADLRLLRVRNLQIDEAPLTGESLPVEKAPDPVAADAPLGDRASMAYAGTLVTAGRGAGVVVGTGVRTEIGRISALVSRVEKLTTPLLQQLAVFGRKLSFAILALAAAAFAFGLARGYGAAEMFMAAVGIAVAAIPEGLPAIMTITLAIGVQRMARRNAIIRRLPAVETLGSVTVICSDKTGTLTRNEMTVRTVATAAETLAVSGVGYGPEGSFHRGEQPVAPGDVPGLAEIARAAALCNDAHLRRDEAGEWSVEGDPTEGALLALAARAELDPDAERRAVPRVDAIPFESEHRFMATLHHDHEGNAFAVVKGAPERVLEMCDRQRGREGEEPLDLEAWHERMAAIADRGERLLAVAVRRMADGRRELRFADVESGLTLLALLGIADPPRQDAIEAIAVCREAGIRVKMITGDHAGTARAIGRELGLAGEGALTGQELEGLGDEALREAAAAVDVFARTSPQHKLRLVEALQARGEVVAMTGDGVNDAPALKRADVGIAMGRKGTEAAKEAAEMVLADDRFDSIASAVEEGRGVYDNLRKALLFILPTNGAQAFALLTAIVLGQTLPMTPVQILWVNMVTAVTLALALAFEPVERDVMQRPPRRPDEPLLSRFLLWRLAFVASILLAGVYALFRLYVAAGAGIEQARTVAVNTLVAFEIFYLWSARSLLAPAFDCEGLVGSRPALAAIALVIAFQVAFTYAPPMQRLFHTVPLEPGAWLRIVAVASSVLVLVELEKAVLRRRAR
jgi:magnesium-transporting ATPase (P-type)